MMNELELDFLAVGAFVFLFTGFVVRSGLEEFLPDFQR